MRQDGRYVIDVLSFCCLLAVCKEGIVHYYEGDMWNVSNCKFCICHNGQKSCSFAQCAKIKCGAVNVNLCIYLFMYCTCATTIIFSISLYLYKHVNIFY